MSEDPACCSLDDNIFSVIDTFRGAGMVRRMPVVNENKEPLGVVSLSGRAGHGPPLANGCAA